MKGCGEVIYYFIKNDVLNYMNHGQIIEDENK